MKRLIQILTIVLAVICLLPAFSWAKAVGGTDLLLSTDQAMFDKGGVGYIAGSSDPWLMNSYVTYANSFELFIYNSEKDKGKKKGDNTARDIQLLIAVHAGEAGQVNVGGATYSSFAETLLPGEYSGGSHGIYVPDDGNFAIAPLGFDLGPQAWQSVEIYWWGFTEVHFDAFSANGFYNSAKNDVTAVVPLPSSMLLFAAGLVCLLGFGKRKKAGN